MANKTDRKTMGVILLNLGGPDSLQAVMPFLYNLFSDRQIIQLGPSFLQRPIAWLIATLRSKKTEKFYSLIGGKSPIFDITTAQAKALDESLKRLAFSVQRSAKNSELQTPNSKLFFRVYIGMRYWHPLIEEVIPKIYNDGIERLLALSLYPHYSLATTGSSLSKFKNVVLKYPIEVSCIESWFNHPLYIEALVDVIKKGLESFTHLNPPLTKGVGGGVNSELDIHVIFSAHSLPQKFIDKGDPYVNQIMGTIEEITKRIQIKWHLSYQSKSGPVKWLEPSIDDKLKELAGEGIRNVLIVPISFVSDHIETLYEIDILYKQMAEGLGVNLRRTESLNTHPLFIEALKDIVIRHVKELRWIE